VGVERGFGGKEREHDKRKVSMKLGSKAVITGEMGGAGYSVEKVPTISHALGLLT